MKWIVILLIMFFWLTGCTNPQKATDVLSSNGYSDIIITGYNFGACSEDDFYHTGFNAKSPSGKFVSGTVCSGLILKGSTIRFD